MRISRCSRERSRIQMCRNTGPVRRTRTHPVPERKPTLDNRTILDTDTVVCHSYNRTNTNRAGSTMVGSSSCTMVGSNSRKRTDSPGIDTASHSHTKMGSDTIRIDSRSYTASTHSRNSCEACSRIGNRDIHSGMHRTGGDRSCHIRNDYETRSGIRPVRVLWSRLCGLPGTEDAPSGWTMD